MIYDIFTYNNEKEILDIHLNVLKNHVDQFIVVEFDKTFSGKDKPYYFKLKEYEDFPIRYVTFDESHYEKYRELAELSPNTSGANHWKREFMQKESLKDALIGLEDDDIIYIGDVDEIWQKSPFIEKVTKPSKLKLKVYSYWLNNRSSEEFWGTLFTRYKWIKDKCLNHLRSDKGLRTDKEWGWHFTSMGGYEEVKRKLEDSYTRESYWTEQVENNLEQNLVKNKDFLGRDFSYTTDESEWPQYLKDNRYLYQHLLK